MAGKPRANSFERDLQRNLEKWSEETGHPTVPKWVFWKDGIYPEYRRLLERAVLNDPIALDDQIHHLRSSQAFAFNLFLPFRHNPNLLSGLVSDLVEESLTIDEVRFEWVPPPSVLVEPDGYVTAVDVVLWSRLQNGGRAVVLLEVKLSENKFSPCGGHTSFHNDRPDVCRSASVFFDDPDACYLIRSQKAEVTGRTRRYWEIFSRRNGSVAGTFPNADTTGGCPFAQNMNQPMRNLAIAFGLEQTNMVQRAWYGLCAHDDNTIIRRLWGDWQSMLPSVAPGVAPFLPTSEVIRVGEAEGMAKWADYMRNRYLIPRSTE